MSEEKNIKNQTENNNNEAKEDESRNGLGLSLGICLGAGLGISFGQLLFHDLALGLCLGMGIGLCLGTAYDAFKKDKKADGVSADESENKQDAGAEPEEKNQESGE